MSGNNNGNEGQNGAVIRFTGNQEEKYPGWKFWAKAWLHKKKRYGDDHVTIENEGELAVAELQQGADKSWRMALL